MEPSAVAGQSMRALTLLWQGGPNIKVAVLTTFECTILVA